MSVIHEFLVKSFQCEGNAGDVSLPDAISLPWHEENAKIRIYHKHSPTYNNHGVSLKVKLCNDHDKRVQGYLCIRSFHKITLTSPVKLVLLFPERDALQHSFLEIEFDQPSNATRFVEAMRKSSFKCGTDSFYWTGLLQDSATFIDQVAGKEMKYRRGAKSWQPVLSRPSHALPGATAVIAGQSANGSGGAAAGSDSGIASDEGLAAIERPAKAPRIDPYVHNAYMTFEKERLVEMIVARDQSLLANDVEIATLKDTLRRIQTMASEKLGRWRDLD